MNFSPLSSRVTGPKMRVPVGCSWGPSSTAALSSKRISDPSLLRTPFVVHTDPATHDFRRNCLLNGLDDIALTLQHEDKIAAYEARHTIT